MKKVALSFIIGLAFFQNCAVNPVTGKKEFMLLSREQEVEMGKASDPDIVAAFGLYPSERLQNFIDEKGKQMAAISHRAELTYQFKILDSPVVNAFAVPGGYVYFTRGIMAHFNNEAEFAGVLGHEIGHIAARHSAKQYSRAMAAQLGLAVGSIVSEEFARFSDLAQTGVGILFLKFGRDAERQSDELGVEYSTKIGYNADEMAGFFNTLERMQQEAGQAIPTFLSTHPDPGERNQRVKKLAQQWQQKTGRKEYNVNRNAYLQMIDGIIYGADPRQGYVDDQTFFHPELKFQFPVPSQWQLENTPQQVSMAPSAGDAVIFFSIVKAGSLEEAASGLVSKYQLNVQVSQKLQINGFPAMRVTATQTSGNQEIGVIIHVIRDGDIIYDFIAATTPERYSTYLPVLDRVAQNFARLTDPSRINVQPKRIHVREVTSGGTLQQALTSFGVTSNDNLEEHAIVNGMELNQHVQAGTLLKIIN